MAVAVAVAVEVAVAVAVEVEVEVEVVRVRAGRSPRSSRSRPTIVSRVPPRDPDTTREARLDTRSHRHSPRHSLKLFPGACRYGECVRVRIFTEPQMGATYEQLLEMARLAEACGFDAFFRSDHYLTMGGDGLPGPTDAWITLGALARETRRIRLGTLVSSATFRWPGIPR
jgi:hypothetical protein